MSETIRTPVSTPDAKQDTDPAVGLTVREREVLRHLCRRVTDRELAAQLFVSPRTVGTHVGRVIAKLGAANRREAAAIAARHGWA